MRRCPYCAEDIADDTTRCPHCGSDLANAPVGAGSAIATPSPVPGPGGTWPQPATAGPPTGGAGQVQFSHTGQRYLLGYDAADFGIWDRGAPGAPVERFPRSDDGWSQAWRRYASLEPNSQPVQAGPPAGAAAPPASAGAYQAPGGSPWQQGQPVYYVPQQRRTNGLAVAALVLGILGLVFFAFFAVPPALALIFGIVSLGQIKGSNGTQDGQGLAIAGIVLGSVGLLFFVIWLVAVITNHTTGF